MGKSAGLILLILGLALGPGHFIYTRFFTGKLVMEQPLRFSLDASGQGRAEANVFLESAALPASLVLSFSATHGPVMSPPNTPQNHYRAGLLKNGEQVFEKSFTLRSSLVEATPAIQFSEAVMLPENLSEGNYVLTVLQEGEAEMDITAAKLQLRANVAQFDTSMLAIGFGLLAAGIAIVVLSP